MEIKIKSRDSGYCNLKVLLMFLVVYGHLIEEKIGESGILLQIYKLIYMVHMPLFVFLSGFFLKGKENSFRQMTKTLKMYVLLQGALVVGTYLIKWMVGNILPLVQDKWAVPKMTMSTPYWHFWYLLSLSVWAGISYLWHILIEKVPKIEHWLIKLLLIGGAIALSCYAGMNPNIGRKYSLSRTIVFLPYLLAGIFCPKDIKWKRFHFYIIGVVLGIISALVIHKWGKSISYSFLYQAASYGRLSIRLGVERRLICYLIGFCLSLELLIFTPTLRFPFSKVGSNTLGIYICHGFVVKALRVINFSLSFYLYLVPVVSIFIICFFYKLFQWNTSMYRLSYSNQSVRQRKKNHRVLIESN